jgi:hypothetical protein
MSSGLNEWQKKGLPLTIADEYADAEDKAAKRQELREKYPHCESVINFLCCCNSAGEPRPNIQLVINSSKYMLDFIKETPPCFKISADCCTYCKKNVAHKVQAGYEMVITGERRDEGGMRSVPRKDNTALCFGEQANGQFRLRPLYYVSDSDKAWYKEHYGIRYSDAYEVYGLTRTGCCGCSISHKAIEDLEKIAQQIEETLKNELFVKTVIGIGTIAEHLRSLADAYKEAQTAIDVGKVFDTEKSIINYENLGIGRLIYQLPTTLCEIFLSEVFKKNSIDSLDQETLFTINKFFENNLNVSETSRKLFVHRNTLVYRLEKIKKLTGLDLREFDHAIIFKVALMVRKYLSSREMR